MSHDSNRTVRLIAWVMLWWGIIGVWDILGHWYIPFNTLDKDQVTIGLAAVVLICKK